MLRASIEAASALMSSGNSRNTKRTLPVSIYLDLSIGKTFCSNAAQWGQLIDAYSMMVTEAVAGPSAMSGSDTGFATRAAIAACALASLFRCSGGAKAKIAVSDTTVAKARRGAIHWQLRNPRLCTRQTKAGR